MNISTLLDLSGKRAVVTGAAAGIGLAIAKRLREAGAAVALMDRDATALSRAAEAVPGAHSITADVSDVSAITRAFDDAAAQLGGIDMLVNNAGIYPRVPVLEASVDDVERTIRVNLLGAMYCAQAAARHMKKQGTGGSIVNITSIDALHPSSVGLAFYDASKHGLWGFTKNLALELAPLGIRVNAVAPASVQTPGRAATQAYDAAHGHDASAVLEHIPEHRLADPDEIATAVLFLVSDMASYITGSQLVVDGGRLLS